MDRELGVGVQLAVDSDRPAVLLRDDVIGDRQPEPRPFAGRLGRKEWLEQPIPDLGRDAGAVVAYPDLNRLARLARRNCQHRPKCTSAVAGALSSRIEAIVD